MGYVVDMIETTFIRFPVFNVADIFITCGCILMLLHLMLVNKEFWKDEKK
jgi:signal peptidase II